MTARAAKAAAIVVSLHEAGHAVVSASLGLPLTRAWACKRSGGVEVDWQAHDMRRARARRRASRLADDRSELAAALLRLSVLAIAGEAAVYLREHCRPRAPWLAKAGAGAMSRGDRLMWRRASDGFAQIGISADAMASAAYRLCDETLTRHEAAVARLARALLARRSISGPEVARLLGPAAPCFATLSSLQEAASALLAASSPLPRPAH